ncbi:MAG TPA: uracil-DNA glycosylase [Acidimicrobiales bacterium]|nr:uracil-DNA glycosylase [Acidimicrobiales bacterium]
MATLAELAAIAAQCTRCPLAESRTTVVFGAGDEKAPLMFVGEAPGRDEDLSGLPFVGRSGKLLDELMLSELGVTRERCFIANTVKCRPPGNRDPSTFELESCRPYLEGQLDLIEPKVVITLGNFATKLLLLGDPGAKEGITKLRGKTYPWRGAVLVPTFHPAAALRSGGETLAGMRADFVRAKRALVDAGISW